METGTGYTRKCFLLQVHSFLNAVDVEQRENKQTNGCNLFQTPALFQSVLLVEAQQTGRYERNTMEIVCNISRVDEQAANHEYRRTLSCNGYHCVNWINWMNASRPEINSTNANKNSRIPLFRGRLPCSV